MIFEPQSCCNYYTCKSTSRVLMGHRGLCALIGQTFWRISLLLSHLQRFSVTRAFSEALSVDCRGWCAQIHVKKNFNKVWQISCIESADMVKQDLCRVWHIGIFFNEVLGLQISDCVEDGGYIITCHTFSPLLSSWLQAGVIPLHVYAFYLFVLMSDHPNTMGQSQRLGK